MPHLFRRRAAGAFRPALLPLVVLFASAVLAAVIAAQSSPTQQQSGAPPGTQQGSTPPPTNQQGQQQGNQGQPEQGVVGGKTPPTATARPTVDSLLPLTVAWTASLGVPAVNTVAYDESRVFVATRATDEEPAKIVAASVVDGSVTWKAPLDGAASIAASDGLVFVATERLLHGFDARTGEARWETPLDSPVSAPLYAATGWLIVATKDAKVAALRTADGSKVWTVEVPAPVAAAPALSGDALYLGQADKGLSRLKLETGAQVWRKVLDGLPAGILPLDDRVFVGTRGRWFYAVDPRTGKVPWRVSTGAEVVGVPVADTRRVYFATFANLIRGLDRHNGSVRAQHVLGRRAYFGPYRLGDFLAVSGISSTVEFFAVSNLKPASTFELGEATKPVAPLHVVSGLVERDVLILVFDGDGNLSAIRPAALSPR